MSSVETISAIERRLNASIPQQAIRTQVVARLKHIGRTAKIPGFRPGKIPPKVLEQHYGAQAQQEALGEALNQSFAEAAESNKLRVAGYPRFELKTTDLNAPEIEYSATFEVYPDVVLGDLAAEVVERAVYEVGQSDVEHTIETLGKQRATFEKVDRAAQAEDQVNIDFTGTLNGEVFKGGEAKDYPFQLGVGRMLPEFEAAITGMKAGESKSFDMTFPESYHGKDVAGKQVTFTITLNSVEAPKLPEVNEEFVRSIGIESGDVAKMEAEIMENLQREVSRRLSSRRKAAVMDLLLKVAQFETPKSLVEWEIETLMRNTAKEMEESGMKGMQLPRELFVDRAEKRIKLGLILADLAEKQDLKGKPEQVRALIDDLAQNYDKPEDVVNWYYSDPMRLQEVENMAIEDNLVTWVLGQAKAEDKAIAFNELMGS